MFLFVRVTLLKKEEKLAGVFQNSNSWNFSKTARKTPATTVLLKGAYVAGIFPKIVQNNLEWLFLRLSFGKYL